MSKFNPKITATGSATDVPGQIAYRMSMFLDSDVEAQGKSARIIVGEADTLEIRVAVANVARTDEEHREAPKNPGGDSVTLEVTVHAGSATAQLATVSVPKVDAPGEQRALSNEVQREFFNVMAAVAVSGPAVAVATQVPTAVPPPSPQAAEGVERQVGARVTKKIKRGAVAVALLGLGVAASGGVYAHFFSAKPAPEVAQAEGFSDIQKKIEAEIRAGASGGSGASGLQGQNVGIQTMKAMGLDPGKANTGCLVGVR